MYGHAEPVSIAVDEHEFTSKFRTISENIIIKLNISGKNHDVLVKDFQDDILTGKIVHLDFYEIEKGKLLKTTWVPLAEIDMLLPQAYNYHTISGSKIYILREDPNTEQWELHISEL